MYVMSKLYQAKAGSFFETRGMLYVNEQVNSISYANAVLITQHAAYYF